MTRAFASRPVPGTLIGHSDRSHHIRRGVPSRIATTITSTREHCGDERHAVFRSVHSVIGSQWLPSSNAGFGIDRMGLHPSKRQ
jgi:hypothetical protein